MPDVLTFLLIELGSGGPDAGADRTGEAELEAVAEAVRGAGGAVVGHDRPDEPGGADGPARPDAGTVTAAVFQLAADAARAAAGILQAPPAPLRMALCTGEAHASGATLGGPARLRATELLRQAAPLQALVTASTAVMASAALPRHVELLDVGARVLGDGRPPERVYELRATRPPGGDAASADDATASNLDWARRAAHGSVLGRDRQLAALESAWKATVSGDRRMVLLAGDGGIGKTTLAAELALRLHTEGALVLYGRWDQGSLAPYQAVREALGTYAGRCPTPLLRRDLEGRSDEIARLLPDVGTRVGGVRAPLLGDPDGERLRLFEAIEAWLDLMAQRRPVLLVLDDLHWAGRSSLLLVDHLSRHRSSAPVMVVLTSREGELPAGEAAPDVLGRLREAPEVERVELHGLDATVVVRLVEQALGRPLGPADAGTVDWLAHDTAGNPLFVREVLRSVADSPDTGEALRGARHRLPRRLADIVDWRLAQLPSHTAEVLADAALIGPTFPLGLLADATGTAPVVLRGRLDTAVQAGLLRAQPAEDYAFAHEVVRRTLHDQLDPEHAAALHRRIAAALTRRALDGQEVSAVVVADHHLRGADATTARQAVRWARHAAEAARRETAFESAVQLLARAVEVHDRVGPGAWFRGGGRGTGPGGRGPATAPGDVADQDDLQESHGTLACELRLELAEAHDRAGEFGPRDERHLEAAALARQLDRTDLFTRAALGLRGRLPASPAPDPTARQLIEEALTRLPAEDGRGRAQLLARLAHVRHLDAPYDERRGLSDEAVAMARRLDAPVVVAEVLVARCLALAGPDDTDDELAIGEEIVRIGERTGDPDLVLQGLRVQISPLLVLGRHDEARAQAATFTKLANQVRHPDHLRIGTMWEVLGANLEGRYDDARALVIQLREQLRIAGHRQSTSIRLIQTFPVMWLRRGRAGFEAPAGPPPAGELTSTSSWAIAAWLDVVGGREEQALARLAEQDPVTFVANVRRDYMWWPTMVLLALTASRGAPPWAAALSERLAPYQGRNCLFGLAAFAGAVDHHLGTLALALDRVDDGIRHLESALERHRALGATPFVALTARWLAHGLARRGDPADRARRTKLRAESDVLAGELGLRGIPELSG